MKKIIIFGRGRYFFSKRDEIEKKYQICGYIDNAIKQNEEQEIEIGLKMYSPVNIDCLSDIPIMLMSVKQYEMAKQLIDIGVSSERIIFGNTIHPFYDKTEELFAKYNYKLSVENKDIIIETPYGKECVNSVDLYNKKVRELFCKDDKMISIIAQMPLQPVSRRWGLERGKAIDRYYIEKFLKDNAKYITGDVMEIADDFYTKKYGSNINKSVILHVNGWGENCVKGNLETGEGIKEDWVDCLICTQTIETILNLKEVLCNIHKLLKKGGTALITCAGIKNISEYDYYNWGEYWRFTKLTLEKMLMNYFELENITVNSFGNVKTTIGMLYGLCQEDLSEGDFIYNDDNYPLIVTVRVTKK